MFNVFLDNTIILLSCILILCLLTPGIVVLGVVLFFFFLKVRNSTRHSTMKRFRTPVSRINNTIGAGNLLVIQIDVHLKALNLLQDADRGLFLKKFSISDFQIFWQEALHLN